MLIWLKPGVNEIPPCLTDFIFHHFLLTVIIIPVTLAPEQHSTAGIAGTIATQVAFEGRKFGASAGMNEAAGGCLDNISYII
jgi:hypothetical protein